MTSLKLLSLPHEAGKIRRFAYLLITLVSVQISLGVFTVITRKAIDVTTAHVAAGALLLVSTVLLSLHAARYFGLRMEGRSLAFTPREATA